MRDILKNNILFILNYRSGTNLWKFLNGKHTVAFSASKATRAIVGGEPLTNPLVKKNTENIFFLPTIPAEIVPCDLYTHSESMSSLYKTRAYYTSHGDWWGEAKSADVPEPYELACEPRYGPDEIRALKGNWKIIYITRDGRNQIESLRNIPGGIEMKKHAEDPKDYFEVLCKGYRNRARMALDCEAELDNFKIFHFEKFIASPITTIRDMYKFAGLEVDLDFVGKTYHYALDKDVAKQHSSFGGTNGLHERWHSWTNIERRIFNQIAGRELLGMGYK